jgi:hypothetical protein
MGLPSVVAINGSNEIIIDGQILLAPVKNTTELHDDAEIKEGLGFYSHSNATPEQ